MDNQDGSAIGQAALDAVAQVGEHYPDDELVGCVILVLLRDGAGELHTHTHTMIVSD